MTLEDEITAAQDYISDPPKNESNTCEQIILPLLWSAGYARRDIESRIADSTGQFPDYTLLPNHSSAIFYLEAKGWNVTLEDIHAKQALNYANHNGRRFVVLTNGKNWRLYDNAIQGVLAEKLLIQAELCDTFQITSFLSEISKQQVLEGSLERIAAQTSERKLQEAHDLEERQRREEELQSIYRRELEIKQLLNTMLPDMLKAPDSELLFILADYLKNADDFSDMSLEILSEWFKEKLNLEFVNSGDQIDVSTNAQIKYSNPFKQQNENTLTLRELQGRSIDGKKSRPIMLYTPDGSQFRVGSWVDLAVQIIKWLLQKSYIIPLPFESSHRTRWFLNNSPQHKSADTRQKFKEISAHGQTVYMDSDRPGKMFLEDLHALCLAIKLSPDVFQIEVNL